MTIQPIEFEGPAVLDATLEAAAGRDALLVVIGGDSFVVTTHASRAAEVERNLSNHVLISDDWEPVRKLFMLWLLNFRKRRFRPRL